MSFHPGQLVVCTDAEDDRRLAKGRVYTVVSAGTFGGIPCVCLKEAPHPNDPRVFFVAARFRPIHERQHALVKSMMNAALVGARLPQMKAGEARRSPPAASRPDGRGSRAE